MEANICRTCTEQSSGELVPIFSKLEDQFIANVIVDCSSITINEDDGLPTSVCVECLSNVRVIVRFAQKVRESDRKLRQLFKGEEPAVVVGGGGFDPDECLPEVKVEFIEGEGEEEGVGVPQQDVLKSDVADSGSDFENDADDSDWKGEEKEESEDEPPPEEEERRVTRKRGRVTRSASKVPKEPVKKRRFNKPAKRTTEDDLESDGEDELDEVELETFKLVEIDSSRLVCCLCCKDFATEDELKQHGKKKHTKKSPKRSNIVKEFECDVCYRRYCTKDALKFHKESAAELVFQKIYECKRCAARFNVAKRRRNHAHNHPKYDEVLEAETEAKRVSICCMRNCAQEFETEEELFEHGQKNHVASKNREKPPGKPHECPVCFKCFETEKAIFRHRRRMYHPTATQCSICGKEFKSNNALITHERKHMNEKPFACELCEKPFPTLQALKNHMLVHKDDKPFMCTVCGWSFKRECNLKIHMLTHSEHTPWKCEVCGKAFKVLEDDSLPTQICSPCLDDLKETNVFVKRVRSADRKLRNKVFNGEASDEDEKDNGADDLRFSADDTPAWQVSSDELKQESDLKTELDDGVQVIDGDLEDSSRSDEEPDTEENNKQFLKRKRRSNVYRTSSTNSDSDEEEPIRKRRRQRRARKLEHIVSKGDESEDDSIPENRLAEMYKTIQVDAHGHVCCACLKIFPDRSELIQHGQSTHTKKKYINESKTNICDVCFRRYSKAGPLEVHKQSFVGLDVVYECYRCLTRVVATNRRQHVRTHLKHHEGSSKDDDRQAIREQRCCAKDCSASFPSEELLLEHGKEVHTGSKENTDDPQRRYECPVCFKRFNKRDALTRHRHRMYRATHQCAVCGKEFRNRYEMLVHERNHDNVKSYSCEICAKRFNSKEAVRVHMLIHSDSKPFACTICGWRFRRKCNLNKHASKHSEDTPFECGICQKTFKGKYHLQYHMRIHTGQKPFPCRYCDKSFACHANRKRHETSHTGIKPYKCTYCDKTFIRKRFQIEHESTHTGIKPYRCEMCNRSFSQKTSLKKHLEIHPLAPENQLALAQPSPMPAAAESPMSPMSLPPPPQPPPPSQLQQPHQPMGPPPAGQHHPNLMTAAMMSAIQGTGGSYQHPI